MDTNELLIYVGGIVLVITLNIIYQRYIHPTGQILDELKAIRKLLEKKEQK